MKPHLLIVAWLAAALLATPACDRSRLSGSPADAAHGSVAGNCNGTDFMEFVVLHQKQMGKIIRERAGDCEETLAQLLRYVADNRRSFLETCSKKRSAQETSPAIVIEATSLLMNFADSCPAQIARLNQALHKLID